MTQGARTFSSQGISELGRIVCPLMLQTGEKQHLTQAQRGGGMPDVSQLVKGRYDPGPGCLLAGLWAGDEWH